MDTKVRIKQFFKNLNEKTSTKRISKFLRKESSMAPTLVRVLQKYIEKVSFVLKIKHGYLFYTYLTFLCFAQR